MKNILNGILGLFISYIPTVYAGLPPTTVKGQSETTPTTTFNIQTPYNAATTSASGTRYIDSGNRNVLLNSSFEATTATTSWTATTATGASESTVVVDGKKSYKLTFAASTGDVSQSVTPTIQMDGMNFEATCKVKTTLSTIQVCALAAGTEIQCSNVSPSTWGNYSVNFPGPSSGSVGVKVKTTSSTTGSVYVDDCYVGPARNVGIANSSTDWVSYTPTFVGFGTPTNIEFQWRREAGDMLIRGKVTSGTVTAVNAEVGLPTGYTSAGTSVIPSSQICGYWALGAPQASFMTILCPPSVSYFNMGVQNASFGGSDPRNASTAINPSTVLTINARVPIQGWQAQGAVTVDQTDTDWVAYTPVTQALGTVSNVEVSWRREGSDMLIRGKLRMGTTTAAIPQVGLPSGYTTADTTKIPSVQLAGNYGQSAAIAGYYPVVILPSVTYINFAIVDATKTALDYTQLASNYLISSNDLSFVARVPIQGWSATRNAPLLVGSVTSNSSGTERIERARINNTGSPTVVSQSGNWISSLAFPGTGFVDITIAAGIFSAAPSCNITMWATATYGYFASIPTTPTATLVKTAMIAYTGVAANEPFEIVCMGPR